METLQNLGLFAAQTFLILFAVIAVILVIAILAAKAQQKSELQIELLHKKFDFFRDQLKAATLSKADAKSEKKRKKKLKNEDKTHKLFVLDFKGGMQANEVDQFREEVTAVLTLASPSDEVLVRVESPGGVVHGYGLAASQLLRLREHKIPLTVCIDKVAASGGYLMACTASKILAAPFAIVGSVGVVAQVPNFNRLLKKFDVDYKEYTAGEFKRTVSLFGEITEKGEEKFKEQLEDTHKLFKSFVHKYRPHLDLSKVATGEYWYGEQALALGLVDHIQTSDDYIMHQAERSQIIHVKYEKKVPFSEKLTGILGRSIRLGLVKSFEEIENRQVL